MSEFDRKLENQTESDQSPPRALGVGPNFEVDTMVLMNGRREMTIVHAGERYRLRITANDKLILTK